MKRQNGPHMLEITALQEMDTDGPHVQILNVFERGSGIQRVVLRVFTEMSPLTVKFRLFRYRKDDPDIVTAVAAIERGEEFTWPSCTLSMPTRGKLSDDSKLLTGITVGRDEIDSIFEVSWHALADMAKDRDLGLSQSQQVNLLPWIAEG